MLISFRTKKLQKQFEQSQIAVKAYGTTVARKYIQRINIIKSAGNMDTLRTLPGLRCHPLKGDKKDYWAINLTGYYRLIFSLTGEKLEIVRIERVTKHYDE